jgi:hypothetical protein
MIRMPFDVQADEARRLVVVPVRGTHDAKSVLEMVTVARETALARGWNILYDMRAAQPGDMTSAELYWLPRRVPALGRPEAARMRVAVVHLPQHAALADYWETTFRNASLRVKAFTEESAAVDWLRS